MLKNENNLLHIVSAEDFRQKALQVFRHQASENAVYAQWLRLLGVDPRQVKVLSEIPFLPVVFFKSHRVVCGDGSVQKEFTSSGTTGTVPARHLVSDLGLYEQSFLKTFEMFYGPPSQYCILALLPGYLERTGSSLVYMVDALIRASRHGQSGFYLKNLPELKATLERLKNTSQKVLLIGVSYALLDLCETGLKLGDNVIVMETGGMKGTRREMLKSELHQVLRAGLGVKEIHSEYGMTELLSQAYSKGDGLFQAPPWMKFLIREVDDPFSMRTDHRTGGVNVIDLANVNSCAFISTQDLGRLSADNRLELMGRFDDSDIRGCNLLLQ